MRPERSANTCGSADCRLSARSSEAQPLEHIQRTAAGGSEIAPDATQLFEEPGALDVVVSLATGRFAQYLDEGPGQQPAA